MSNYPLQAHDDLIYTLVRSITSTQTTDINFTVTKGTDSTVAITPSSDIKYITVDKDNENYEHIYFPNGFTENSTGNITLNTTGLVRGIAFSGVSLIAVVANQKGHTAGAEAGQTVYAMFMNIIASIFDGVLPTGANAFRNGDGTDSDIYYFAQNADGNKPYIRYDAGNSIWYFSNDGVVENPIPTSSGAEADASETVKGIVEMATTLEVLVGTDTGGTGAQTVPHPSDVSPAPIEIDVIPVVNTNSIAEETLYQVSIPANILASGRSLRFKAYLDITGIITSLNIKVKYGSTTLLETGAITATVNQYFITGDMFLPSTGNQTAYAEFRNNVSFNNTFVKTLRGVATEDETTTLNLTITTQANSTASVVTGEFLSLEVIR